jgi:hypothetical protein
LFEKAKHQDGDMHPNGKWVWVSSANGGKGDWRTKGGRTHTKHSAGDGNLEVKTDTTSTSTQQKPNIQVKQQTAKRGVQTTTVASEKKTPTVDAYDDIQAQIDELKKQMEVLSKKKRSMDSDLLSEMGFDKKIRNEDGDLDACKLIFHKNYGQCKLIIVHPYSGLQSSIVVKDPSGKRIFDGGYKTFKSAKEFSQYVEEFEKDPQGTLEKFKIQDSESFKKAISPYATGKNAVKGAHAMTNTQLFKKYKIPEVIVEKIYTKKGWEHNREGFKSTENKQFVSQLKDAIDKYGAPIKVEKRKVDTYNTQAMRNSARQQIEYEYVKGTVVDVTFKDSDGKTYVVSSDSFDW